MSESVLITGSEGGIGAALVAEFRAAGYFVIGSGRAAQGSGDAYLCCDLAKLMRESAYREERTAAFRAALPVPGRLSVLINNAAYQVVRPVEALTLEDFQATQDVNVAAPFWLVKAFLVELEAAAGCVINIASIHGQLTKPEFSAYATSKTALVGLTRALAVELGGRVRVNALAPAAICTPMLVAGFSGREEAFRELAAMHPVGRIGTPEECARAALLLADRQLGFLTGAVLGLDGAIGARLHDPV